MGGKAAIAAGLISGAAVGAIVVGAVVLLAPVPAPPASPPVAVASAPPSAPPSASPSAPPPIAPSASAPASAAPSSPTPGSPSPGAAFGVGEPAPPLRVPALGGGDVAIDALKGTPVWVNFMATWCEPCRDEIPLMNTFAARYADDGLVVVAVDVREDETVVDAFMRELNVVFPVGLDADGAAQSDWGAIALPVHFWVDADGVVRDGALGGIGADIMVAGLRSILPGVDVTP